MKYYRLRSAFTMLELIIVMSILGIVASIGTEMIVKVYESYIVQRAEHRATLKTELAATQIANRLASAIPGTVYRIRTNDTYELIDSDFPSGIVGDDYKGLQWVSSDTDSFAATATPGWSGFCDIDNSSNTILSTPGSSLGLTNTIIGNLSSGKSISDAAIYFPYDTVAHTIASVTTNTITLDNNLSTIVEHYKLAWSSYALVVEGGDLYLYYDFNPTPATAVGNTRSLLMRNISTFKFKGSGRTIRFKICKEEPINEDTNITACKEKAVF